MTVCKKKIEQTDIIITTTTTTTTTVGYQQEEEMKEDNERKTTLDSLEEKINKVMCLDDGDEPHDENGEILEEEEEKENKTNEWTDETERAEKIVIAQELVAKATQLLDMNEEGMVDSAVAIFNVAMVDAQELKHKKLEARVLNGLATAFTKCPERIAAAPQLFELAGSLFLSEGETGDALSCIACAGETYQRLGLVHEAIECYQKHDSRIDSGGLFADNLARLLLQSVETL